MDDRAGAAAGARDRPQQDARGAALQRVPRVLPGRTRSSTSSRTTTTTSPRRTSRRPTSTSRRTRRSNDDIDRLRHAATSVAPARAATSSSSPRSRASTASARRRSTRSSVLILDVGEEHDRDAVLRKLIDIQYVAQRHRARARPLPRQGRRRRGPAGVRRDGVPRLVLRRRGRADHALRPAHRRGLRAARQAHDLPGDAVRDLAADDRARASTRSAHELEEQVAQFESRGQAARGAPDPPAHRVRPRDDAGARLLQRDRELLAHPRRPAAGLAPFTLLDYFPADFVVFIDESHQTVPQIGGMYEGDRSRKQTLVDYGFRLPSALDNRPLRFDEFLREGAAARVRLGDAGAVRAAPLARASPSS